MVWVRVKKGIEIPDGYVMGKVDKTIYRYNGDSGKINIPFELAIQLDNEIPQRFEIIDKKKVQTQVYGEATVEDISKLNIIPPNTPMSESPKTFPNVKIDFSEIDKLKGIGAKTLKDIKNLFSLVNDNQRMIDTFINDKDKIPLQDDVVDLLSDYFKEKSK